MSVNSTPIIDAATLQEPRKSDASVQIESESSINEPGPAGPNPEESAAPDEPDATDDPSPPAVVEASSASIGQGILGVTLSFPHNLPHRLRLVISQNGQVFAVVGSGNAMAYPIGCQALNSHIRKLGRDEGIICRKKDINDINELLRAEAEFLGKHQDVYYRVASIENGFEIDLGDSLNTRVRITPGKVDIVKAGSDTLFYRTPVSRPMVMPAERGDINLINKYLNLSPEHRTLFIGWLSYTLAHPKVSTSKYPILVFNGDQGSGKTSLCTNIILRLLDPNIVGVQVLPSNNKDLSIATQNAHVLCYDNLRSFKQAMGDVLCMVATGGAVTNRQLYTDAEMNVNYLHCALVLNGIHGFITQPDLAQRTLPLHTMPLKESDRLSDREMVKELERDLPAIFRGLLDLCAAVLQHLPEAEVKHPERMYDFVRWLAAMEKARGIPSPIFQQAYSDALNLAQLESLHENTLAATVLQFVTDHVAHEWSGTPAELLNRLILAAPTGTQHSRDWPKNAISLSKRLNALKASLLTQGIDIEIGRDKYRKITIKVVGGQDDRY